MGGKAPIDLDDLALIDSQSEPMDSDPTLMNYDPVLTDLVDPADRLGSGAAAQMDSDKSLRDSDPGLIDWEARPCGGRRDRVEACETGCREQDHVEVV